MNDDAYVGKVVAADTGLVAVGQPGVIRGVLCTASSTGIFSIYDGGGTTGTLLCGPVTGVAGTFYPLQIGYANGLWFELVSGTGTFTVIYK